MNEALDLTKELVKCMTVTPNDDGSMQIVENFLRDIGFETNVFECANPDGWNVNNLYASFGSGGTKLAFVGHLDVVPVGDILKWDSNPFDLVENGNLLKGRGVADMKAAIACFLSATKQFITEYGNNFPGSIIFMITGDEEEGSPQGTRSLINWCIKNNKMPDYCLIGEPTCRDSIGQAINIGRRGSINFIVKSTGIQGHVAYPEFSSNAINPLISFLNTLMSKKWDGGNDKFPPTSLEITSISVDNEASNIIPGNAEARFNIRYNDSYDSNTLIRMFQDIATLISPNLTIEASQSGAPFICEEERLITPLKNSIQDVIGIIPELSTSGATSDGRFLINYCPVIEFGMPYNTIHKENESIKLSDIEKLTTIYKTFLSKFFFKDTKDNV